LSETFVVVSKHLPLKAMENILRKGGAERVGETAKVCLREILEEKAEAIARLAVRLAGHAGRKTVKPQDIALAAKDSLSEG